MYSGENSALWWDVCLPASPAYTVPTTWVSTRRLSETRCSKGEGLMLQVGCEKQPGLDESFWRAGKHHLSLIFSPRKHWSFPLLNMWFRCLACHCHHPALNKKNKLTVAAYHSAPGHIRFTSGTERCGAWVRISGQKDLFILVYVDFIHISQEAWPASPEVIRNLWHWSMESCTVCCHPKDYLLCTAPSVCAQEMLWRLVCRNAFM